MYDFKDWLGLIGIMLVGMVSYALFVGGATHFVESKKSESNINEVNTVISEEYFVNEMWTEDGKLYAILTGENGEVKQFELNPEQWVKVKENYKITQ